MHIAVSRIALMVLSLAATVARADIVTEWADTATEIATDGPNTVRTMSLIQKAVYEAPALFEAIPARQTSTGHFGCRAGAGFHRKGYHQIHPF